MYLTELRIEGFKSFGKPVTLTFSHNIVAIVGPNGSGKSNIAEAFRFVLGEQSMKSLRGKRGEDLIFNGGNKLPQSNRASVTAVFDNKDRIFADAFDEVAISRTVHRDGTNEYRINNTPVRHQDIIDLFARANVGATNHHIISQGEADRVLSATPEDRKEILEDGLGLRILQFRRSETEKKLKKASGNIAETEAVLRELSPRLQYLKRQVKQREKAQALREELINCYATYLSYESAFLRAEETRLNDALGVFRDEQRDVEAAIAKERKGVAALSSSDTQYRKKEASLFTKLTNIREQKSAAIRDLGRCEGAIAALENSQATLPTEETVRRHDLEELYNDMSKRCEADSVNYSALVTLFLQRLRNLIRQSCGGGEDTGKRHRELLHEQKELQEGIASLEEEEASCLLAQKELAEEKECALQSARDAEKSLFVLRTRNHEAEQKIAEATRLLEDLKDRNRRFEEELREGHALVGAAINNYKSESAPKRFADKENKEQEMRRRDIERKKIRLEEIGTGMDTEVFKEYEEITDRVTFLQQERQDLLDSITDCEQGIAVIQKEIDTRFAQGVRKVNKEFERFFKILFDGGKAKIVPEERVIEREGEDPEVRLGIAVHISLPRKRITSLNQLSGGERTLTSIALLFAISQITPPPFLVLDETDAALDEANSQRYGSMIERLAKKSQLILVTHNRETMHRAGILYGVTMNTTGSSALLSIQFDEALQVAH
ncbi:MAG: AAA family ATPase [Candidatus Kaiserbacteria bacterium]|nr:AAA family ATPase [Candidatus Kaiserbacteria bacterium]